MKMLAVICILIFQTSAFAKSCCGGSCWKDGCCPPRYGCSESAKKTKHMTCFPTLNDQEKEDLKKDLIEVFSPKSGEYISCLEE